MVKIYTLLERDTIETLIVDHRANPGQRTLQRTLAREVTELVHGRERRESVERVTSVLFGGAEFASLSGADLDELAGEIPATQPQSLIAALVAAGIAASNGEAKRLITAGAVSINGQKATTDVEITEISLVKKGKNSFALVR